ncbi:MAG: DEAD/DEAH box helicase, partial [Planctomycetota bacterium]|nr:DEAD/DEAH box helicase [Planctomycetota bacterium]
MTDAGREYLEISVSPEGGVLAAPVSVADDWTWTAPAGTWFDEPGATEALLLAVAAGKTAAPLPPAWEYWRGFALSYIAALCHVPEDSARQSPPPPEPAQLRALASAVPPMPGGEYVAPEVLIRLWERLDSRMREEAAAHGNGVAGWLRERNPAWRLVGKVCFHLAENRKNPGYPFAFLATYAPRLSARGKAQHAPLANALREFAGEKNREALLNLLSPVHRASEKSALARELVDSGKVFHPQAWTPVAAYRFLKDIPVFEEAGLMVRVPDWWAKRPRPVARAAIGKSKSGGLGRDAVLSFNCELCLNGETLSDEDVNAVMAGQDGLVLLKGQWVEVDRNRLRQAIEHWRGIERAAGSDGVSFLEGMRLLAGGGMAGAPMDGGETAAVRDWSEVAADGWFGETLERLRSPGADGMRPPLPAGLKTELRPYQEVGVKWLSFLSGLGLGACLADDMGLGKTIQIITLLLLERESREKGCGKKPSLVVLPASLLGNWRSELERFAPSLSTVFLHPAFMDAKALAALAGNHDKTLQGVDCVFTSYGMALRHKWLADPQWRFVILDEAQAIKNPGTRQTRTVKTFRADARIALTGTPVENRLADLWSLYDFLNPGLLGGAKEFSRFVNRLDARETDKYAPLRTLTRPYILRRLKTDPAIAASLPDKTEVKAFCGLSKKQAALYGQSVRELDRMLRSGETIGVKRRGLILSFLMRFKQICNHPDQWLGQPGYAPEDSGKFARLREIADEIASRRERCLVFTQFREMTTPVADFLAGVFGRPGLVLHGETPVKERKKLADAFQSDNGPPFFVLSLKAGGAGLNLTAASHVVHFDRWWNPAVENQATDRVHRIGQKRNVLVHKFLVRGTIEERIDALIDSKKEIASGVLEEGAVTALTEMTNEELLRFVA